MKVLIVALSQIVPRNTLAELDPAVVRIEVFLKRRCECFYGALLLARIANHGYNGIHIGDRVSTIPAFSMGKYGVYGEKGGPF